MLKFFPKNKLLALLILYSLFSARLNDVSRSGGLVLFSFFFIPLVTFAASCPTPSSNTPSQAPQNFSEFICIILNFINTAFPIMVALTMLVFFWGLSKFILAAGDEKKVADGKRLIFWGIIALFIMVSIWGIINLLSSAFIGGGPIQLPFLPTRGSSN